LLQRWGINVLTKSDIQSFLQCPRKLWLEHHRQDLLTAPDSSGRRRMIDGQIVSERARQQLGADALWPQGHDDKQAAAQAAIAALRASPGVHAVEFPMAHQELYARADAVIDANGSFVLRETKASTFPLKKDKVTPADPKDHHVDDAAIQMWVMEGSGLPIAAVELNLLNNAWRYPGDGDYSGLFRQMDISAAAADRRANVPGWLAGASAVIAGEMPDASVGAQCDKPYACSFHGFCEALEPAGPEHPIELLPDSAGKGLAKKLRANKGYTSILEPAPEELTGAQAELYRRIQAAHRDGQSVTVPGADAILNGLPYPRYYFDFEGIDLPVPRWVGVRPYEQIPFQWSCHIERAPGQFEHAEFLDLTGDDPSLACIQRLQEVINPADGGPILVYFATYEKGRLEGLAQRHPEFSDLLQGYVGRLVDLHALVKSHYYHPDMQGSFSIKKVLPVVAPELDYGALEEIQEGTGAQVAYIEAALDSTTPPERKAEIEQRLKVYCRQDTWAMVRVAYFLTGQAAPAAP
jgi:hypothetical protein